jgi:hypothetical protein
MGDGDGTFEIEIALGVSLTKRAVRRLRFRPHGRSRRTLQKRRRRGPQPASLIDAARSWPGAGDG